MQDKLLYEYAVIRYVPRIEREEFINVGLIMMCKRKKWLRSELKIDRKKLSAYDSPLTADELETQLSEFKLIGERCPGSGPMGQLEAEERFRWLTAVKSAVGTCLISDFVIDKKGRKCNPYISGLCIFVY